MELETNEPPYDPTSVVLVPADFSAATLDQHQIDGCLKIVYYYYGSECADITTPTQLLHAICETEAPKGHPFFSESDFHHSLMQVHKVWCSVVQVQSADIRRKKKQTRTLQTELTADDGWIGWTTLRKIFLPSGLWIDQKSSAKRQGLIPEFPHYIRQIFYGTDGARRNHWIHRWQNTGRDVHDSTKMFVPPQQVEDFFYRFLTVDMGRTVDEVLDFDQQRFVHETLEKEYTKDFLRWFESLEIPATTATPATPATAATPATPVTPFTFNFSTTKDK